MKSVPAAAALTLLMATLRFSVAATEDGRPDGGRPGTVVPSSRIVTTRKGSVRGLLLSWDDKQLSPVEMFLGVPYASPPVGTLRFMPPVTVAAWRTLRVVDRYSPVCPQQFPDIRNETEALKRMPRGRLEALRKLEPLLRNQSEDCLYLNIFTPFSSAFTATPNIRPRYPVIVFIHGESYSWGSGNLYDGSVLAAVGKVVVVTLNYRLGILGFLNPHSDPYSRSISNHGLMDQIAALHWLQENVAEFGGDPTSVTLMGHGTGAACATFLMTSPAVPDGLFQRAVLLSGSALSPWALIQEPAKYALDLARQLNCSSADIQTYLLKCLREKPVSTLTGVRVEAPEFLHAFGPSIDGVVIEDEYEFNHKKLGDRLSRYDLLFGATQAESYFSFSAEDNQYGIEADRRNRLLRTFVRNSYQFHLQEILATIVNEYTDWEKAVLHPINIRDETLEALSDAQYVAPLVRTADLHAAQRHPSYFYVFEYQTKASDYPQRLGCVHGEELAYIFGAPLLPLSPHLGRNYTKAEAALSETVMSYWSNFARSGNPNDATYSTNAEIKHDRSKSKIEWPPYDKQHRRYLSLGLKPKSKGHYRSHKLALWLNLIPDLHRPTGEDVARDHHLLDDYNDPYSYDGKVRLVPATFPAVPTTTPSPMTSAVNSSLLVDSSSNAVKSSGVEASKMNDSHRGLNDLSNRSTEDHFGTYSTALSVTIAIGCSLLILNVLIFAGVYYQRDKQRMELKRRMENGMLSVSISGEMEDRRQQTGPRLCGKPDLADAPSLQRIDANSAAAAARVNVYGDGGERSSIISLTSPFTQLPPPEFADFPSNPPPNGSLASTLPRSSSAGSRSGVANSAATLSRVASSSRKEQPSLTTLTAGRTASLKKQNLNVAAGTTSTEASMAELRV